MFYVSVSQTFARSVSQNVIELVERPIIQLLSKMFLDSDFVNNYLHTPVVLN